MDGNIFQFGNLNSKVSVTSLLSFERGFRNKVVLITGAAGSIGSAICSELLDKVKAVRAFDVDENGLFNLGFDLRTKAQRLRLFLGDVKDLERLERALENVQFVIHLAALKHVELGEYNPFEVLKTNVIGTQTLVNACLKAHCVKKLLLVSSDKSVHPNSTYGLSKAFAERLVLAAERYKGDAAICFASIRLGNVIGTRGSLFYVWGKQIKQRQPLTIRKETRRYFISKDQAVNAILTALLKMKGGEIFIPKMQEKKIMDLALAKSLKTVQVGIRPGEKLREQLYTEEEKLLLKEEDGMLVIR